MGAKLNLYIATGGPSLIIALGLTLTGCGKVGFSENKTSQAGASSVTDPAPPGAETIAPTHVTPSPVSSPGNPADPNDLDVAYSGPCAIFKNVVFPLQIPASTPDVNLSNVHGSNISIPIAKNVTIDADGSSLLLSSAENVINIINRGGSTQVNANKVVAINTPSGTNCIHAMQIGKLESSGGTTKVIAAQVDEVAATSGEIHIYGGIVTQAEATSGRICLHDGAKVLHALTSLAPCK